MSTPDFSGLVKFLVEPFLDSPEALRVDCETHPSLAKVWIRIAFSGEERGKVFGRGGRNVQAIRNVVRATAMLWGWSAHFDVYGTSGAEAAGDGRPRRPSAKPVKPQLRPKP
ncbi:MAG: KH domain-containing protein [Nodosilinea sp.]